MERNQCYVIYKKEIAVALGMIHGAHHTYVVTLLFLTYVYAMPRKPISAL